MRVGSTATHVRPTPRHRSRLVDFRASLGERGRGRARARPVTGAALVALVALVAALALGLPLVLGARSAAAQPAATRDPDPEPTVTLREAHPPSGLGAGVAFGFAGQRNGPSGWVARLEYEALPVLAPRGTNGGVFGFQGGYEYWRSGTDNWGMSLPIAFAFGVRAYPVRATFGLGFDVILIDQVANDTGVGFWAPFGSLSVGVDLFGVRVSADTRLGYRWQIGAEDHARWQLALTIGKTEESRPAKPRPTAARRRTATCCPQR